MAVEPTRSQKRTVRCRRSAAASASGAEGGSGGSGAGAAAGIALINSLGNLGGFAGPYIVGWAKQATNSYSGGLYAIASLALAAVVVTLLTVKVRKGGLRTED